MDMEKLKYTLEKVLKQFPEVTYKIKQSNSTNSAYVRFFYNGRKKTVRVSDHPTESFITTTIGKTNLENFFINNIKKLKRSHIYDLFNDIKKRDV